MDKAEYRIKLDQINELADSGDYKAAVEIVDSIDWRRVKSVRTLCMVGEIYEVNGQLEESRRILEIAYKRASISKTVLYRLAEVCIKLGDFDYALDYYTEFAEVSPLDNSKYILKYKLYRARKSPLEDQITILEEYKDREYTERWAYELAKLYSQAGMKDKCVETCDDLILWFSEGKYVAKAMELKMQYTPLTPSQNGMYQNHLKQILTPVAEPAKQEENITAAGAPTENFDETNAEEAKGAEDADIDEEDEEEKAKRAALRTEAAIEKMDAAAGATVLEEPALKIPTFKPQAGVSSEKSADPVKMQSQLADSIRAVFSGLHHKQVEAPKAVMAPGFEADLQKNEEEFTYTEVKDLEPDTVPTVDGNVKPIQKPVLKPADTEEQIEGQMTLADLTGENKVEEVDLDALIAETASSLAKEVASGEFVRNEEDNKNEEVNKIGDTQEIKIPEVAAEEYKAAEEEQRRIEEEKRRAAEEEQKRIEEEKRKAAEEEQKRIEEEKRKAAEEEQKRIEEEKRKAAEEEQKRIEEEKRKVAEEEQKRIEEEKRRAAEEEQKRIEEEKRRAAEEEQRRIEEEKRKAAEEEAKRKEEELKFARETDETLGLTREFNFQEELKKAMASGAVESEAVNQVIDQIDEIDAGTVSAELDENPEEVSQNAEEIEALEVETVPEIDENALLAAQEEETPSDEVSIEEALLKADGLEAEIEEEDVANEPEQDLASDSNESVPMDDIKEVEDRLSDMVKEEPKRIKYVPVEPRELDEDEKKFFSYFATIPGMSQQITETICEVHNQAGDKTSKTGNILLIGRQGSGKTRLCDGMVMAICKDLEIEAAKVAKIIARDLNEKDPAAVVAKLSGGFLIIEGAGELNEETANKLSQAMEFRTDSLVVMLEDEKADMVEMLKKYPNLAEKFTSAITVPVFTNDELVTFAKTYANECGYRMDEMGVLALYTMIGHNQKDAEPITIARVKDMVDAAIERANKGTRKFGRKLSKKALDEDNRVILYEKDFDFE